MEAIGEYILRLVCGALICGLILSLTGADGPGGKLRSMLCGLFLAYLAVSPLVNLELGDLTYMDPHIAAQAEELAQAGALDAKDAMAQRISEQCDAYILNKADELALTLTAEVTLDPDSCVPVSVRITGTAAPYDRETLIGYITNTLGIERSNIQWETQRG